MRTPPTIEELRSKHPTLKESALDAIEMAANLLLFCAEIDLPLKAILARAKNALEIK